ASTEPRRVSARVRLEALERQPPAPRAGRRAVDQSERSVVPQADPGGGPHRGGTFAHDAPSAVSPVRRVETQLLFEVLQAVDGRVVKLRVPNLVDDKSCRRSQPQQGDTRIRDLLDAEA